MLNILRKFKKAEIAVILGVLITVIFSCSYEVLGFNEGCEEIRGSVLRLHVIANSDGDEDQSLKLKVRDAVLAEGADIFDGSVNVMNAQEKLKPSIDRLEKTARKVIEENGADYEAEITISDEYFDTRTYENVTLPAGKYKAVRVVLGEGKGHNWWCVMFPPMCLPAAQNSEQLDAYLNEDGVKIVESSPKYEPRFKIIEIYEKFRNYIEKQ